MFDLPTIHADNDQELRGSGTLVDEFKSTNSTQTSKKNTPDRIGLVIPDILQTIWTSVVLLIRSHIHRNRHAQL